MHSDSAGLDTQIVDLTASGIQVVVDGVGNIDRVWSRRAIGYQLEPGRLHGAIAGQSLTIGSDLRGNVGKHGNPLACLNHTGGDRVKMLQANVRIQWRI